jgi:hypothetical protein
MDSMVSCLQASIFLPNSEDCNVFIVFDLGSFSYFIYYSFRFSDVSHMICTTFIFGFVCTPIIYFSFLCCAVSSLEIHSLSRLSNEKWADSTLFLHGRKIIVREPLSKKLTVRTFMKKIFKLTRKITLVHITGSFAQMMMFLKPFYLIGPNHASG